ncbi:MAG: phage portal protein [Planctomycetota bacterium]
MAYELEAFEELGLDAALLSHLLAEHASHRVPRLERLWSYYRNDAVDRTGVGLGRSKRFGSGASAGREYRLAQERGLPARLRIPARRVGVDDRAGKPEVVIENDIAWRIDTLVDFVFGKPVMVLSTAEDPQTRDTIERVLDAALEASGGIGLFQDAALLGGVHGYVDLRVYAEAMFDAAHALASSGSVSVESAVELARLVRVEAIEPTRGVPMVNPGDYREMDAFITRSVRTEHALDGDEEARRAEREVVEVLSASAIETYVDGALHEGRVNRLGVLPVVHVQNGSQPFEYEGLSDVEPLIPLQDELNTRLSDRAHRVTLQSFQMYLAKGLEGFAEMPVGPGQVFATDNLDASIHTIGGDAHAPSEGAHIEELRDALDKTSAVSPAAIGVVRERLGHLSSENALRVTMSGILAKTERKRVAYGRGITRVCELILQALDVAGVLRTERADRGVRLAWPDPLPVDENERLSAASRKVELGIGRERALAELGYGEGDPGVQ